MIPPVIRRSFKQGRLHVAVDVAQPGGDHTAYVWYKRVFRRWWNPKRWLLGRGEYIQVVDVKHATPIYK